MHLTAGRTRTALAIAATALAVAATLTALLALPGPAGAAAGTPPAAGTKPADPKPASPPPRYVALGDSYTSAPFVGAPAGAPVGCDRSLNNYPHLVASAIGASLLDVSCQGATTADVSSPQPVSDGVNPPQFDALRTTTTLVTIGIGGNDIGFADIVTTCASLTPGGTPCRDHYTAGGVDQLAARIAATAPKIAAVLAGVHARSPSARVLLVGYPAILPATGPGCYPLQPFTPGDAAYLRGTELRLDSMLAEQAKSAGADYVDSYPSTFGHDVCQPPRLRWIEGVVPTMPAAPVHPNALGERALAGAVLATLDRGGS